MWARLKANQNANSFWIQIDDQCPIKIGDNDSISSTEWQWVNYQNGDSKQINKFQLFTSQIHQVKIYPSETGSKLDKVILLPESLTCTPEGIGDNCFKTTADLFNGNQTTLIIKYKDNPDFGEAEATKTAELIGGANLLGLQLPNNEVKVINTMDDLNMQIVQVPNETATKYIELFENSDKVETASMDQDIVTLMPDPNEGAITIAPMPEANEDRIPGRQTLGKLDTEETQQQSTDLANDYHLTITRIKSSNLGTGAWDSLSSRPQPINIAVIDSGVNQLHPSLKSIVTKSIDCLSGSCIEETTTTNNDHGTHVAGIINSIINSQQFGVAKNANIVSIKAISDEGKGTISNLIAAINYAANSNIQIINFSGAINGNGFSPYNSQRLEEAIDQALAKNILIVAAAGNNADQQEVYPAAYDKTGLIAVGAVNSQYQITTWSNQNRYVDVSPWIVFRYHLQ